MTDKNTVPPETASSNPAGRSTDPVLPPLGGQTQQGDDLPPAKGLSPNLKRGILLFTAFTVMAFGVFGTLLIKKILGPDKPSSSQSTEIFTVAERLYQVGLPEQALNQYQQFLNQPGHSREARAKVSFATGKLFLELGNCPEGLVYFFKSQAAFPDAPWAAELTSNIDHCLAQINSYPKK